MLDKFNSALPKERNLLPLHFGTFWKGLDKPHQRLLVQAPWKNTQSLKYGLQCETQERGKKKWPLDNITDEQWEPVHFMIHICAKSMMKFYHRKYMLQKIMIYDDLMMTIWRSDPTWRASNSLDRLPSGLECCNSPRRTRSLGSSQSLSILIKTTVTISKSIIIIIIIIVMVVLWHEKATSAS